jgi:endonuclease/exonuclease/phosphatase (EEP) superfamily protein YafD
MSKLLKVLIAAGLAICALLTALGLLANVRSSLDIINNGLPYLVAGLIALLCLAFAARARKLIGIAAILLAVNFVLLITGLQGAAPDAPAGSKRFLRVATFNLWGPNDRMDEVANYLARESPDVIVFQEVRPQHGGKLLDTLSLRYPHRAGDTGLVVLSKYPFLADGRIDRAGYPSWMSLFIRWVRLDVNGVEFDLAGVHLARPFYPKLQQQDILTLTRFVRNQSAPLIVAGDFNMSPWTDKLRIFTGATKLLRYNTFHPTWPMHWHDVALLPFVPIDNVFASRQFASIATKAGPGLGSDHRPVIADIALAQPK